MIKKKIEECKLKCCCDKLYHVHLKEVKMKDICVLFNCEDVEDFAGYLEELFLKGNSELKINFQNIGEIIDLTELSTYKLVVILCSPCMIEFFDSESEIERFQKILVNHPCIICLQYYVENDDISRLQTALAVNPKSWKLFQSLETKQECTETIASIFEVLEEQSRVPEIIVKPLPKKRHLRKSKRSAKIVPNCVYKVIVYFSTFAAFHANNQYTNIVSS